MSRLRRWWTFSIIRRLAALSLGTLLEGEQLDVGAVNPSRAIPDDRRSLDPVGADLKRELVDMHPITPSQAWQHVVVAFCTGRGHWSNLSKPFKGITPLRLTRPCALGSQVGR
jgi:hypothetical protein